MAAAGRPKLDDGRVLDLFLAGATYRQIAKAIEVTEAEVEDSVRAAMVDSNARRAFLAGNFDAVALERRESLFRSQYKRAIAGDATAAKVCISLLDGMRDNLAGSGQVVANTDSTETALVALRVRLSAEIDACHDARKLTSLSRQLMAVLAELDSKAPPTNSKRDEVKAKREQRRAAARRPNPTDSGSATS